MVCDINGVFPAIQKDTHGTGKHTSKNPNKVYINNHPERKKSPLRNVNSIKNMAMERGTSAMFR